MGEPESLKRHNSLVEFEEEVDTPSEVLVGEIYSKGSSEKDISVAGNQESKDDSDSNGDDNGKGSTSSDEESSKLRRCLTGCKYFRSMCCRCCKVDPSSFEILCNMLVLLISIAVTVFVVTILYVFEDDIHRNTKSVGQMEDKPRIQERYPLL